MEEPADSITAASFPVTFFNGEHEVDVGNVLVHPSLGFKRFKTLISQKIGVSPKQISTSLVRRKKARSLPGTPRKVPIDESTDFAAISRERDCFVLAILKSSRRTRSQRRAAGGAAVAAEPNQKKAAAILPVKSILKRYPGVGPCADVPFAGNFPESVDLCFWDYERQLQNMQRQREMYLMSTESAAYYPAMAASFPESVPPPPAAAAAMSAACEECLEVEAQKEEGRVPDFHRCVYDAVTVGFRSSVGPIQRPSKQHVGSWF